MAIASDVFYRFSWDIGLANQEQAGTNVFYTKAEGPFFVSGKGQKTAYCVATAKNIDLGDIEVWDALSNCSDSRLGWVGWEAGAVLVTVINTTILMEAPSNRKWLPSWRLAWWYGKSALISVQTSMKKAFYGNGERAVEDASRHVAPRHA